MFIFETESQEPLFLKQRVMKRNSKNNDFRCELLSLMVHKYVG